jgi:hypothetical protein
MQNFSKLFAHTSTSSRCTSPLILALTSGTWRDTARLPSCQLSRERVRRRSKQLVGLLETGPTPAGVSDFMHAHFASHGSLSNVGAIPYPTRARDIELTAIWGPGLSTGVDGEQYLGAVTLNGKLHLTNTSSLPITGLLSKTESILARVSL